MIQHSTRDHALLSPSGAHRWLACPSALSMGLAYPDTPSAAAEEGTKAHEICEMLLREQQLPKDADPDMVRHGMDYVHYIRTLQESMTNPVLRIETRISLGEMLPECYGTADCILCDNDTLHVIDYKYGLAIKVEAAHNPQLMIYAIGALRLCTHAPQTVTLHIYQPRIDNIRSWTLSYADLKQWATSTLLRGAYLALLGGGGVYTPGEQCRLCKAKGDCRAYAQYLFGFDFAKPSDKLSEEEVTALCVLAPEIRAYLDEVTDRTRDRLLRGADIPGVRLKPGRKTRSWSASEDKISRALTLAGLTPEEIYEHKIISPAQAEKKAGKVAYRDTLSALVEETAGTPTVIADDRDYKLLFNTLKQ